MKKKKLVSLMLTGAMAAGITVGLTACGGNTNEEVEIPKNEYAAEFVNCLETKTATNLIVALYEKKRVLHRADVYTIYQRPNGGHYSYGFYVDTKYDFYCDHPTVTGNLNGYPEGLPEGIDKDDLCEGCFGTK